MKLFCFYLIQREILVDDFPAVKHESIREFDKGSYSLYAYTPDKIIAKFFRESRNMNIFFEKTLKISDDEYEDFYEKYQCYILGEHALITAGVDEEGLITTDSFCMICTDQEYDVVTFHEGDIFEEILLNNGIFDLSEFIELSSYMLPELREALNILNLEKIEKYFVPTDEYYDEYDGLIFDEVKMYIKVFSNTLKGDNQ